MRTESWCGHEIRFVEVDGEWWAIFEDIRKTVGVGSYIINDLDDDYLKNIEVDGSWELAINELGVYQMLFMCNTIDARKFKHWSTTVMQKLRTKVGLEQYEVMRMLEKEIQTDIDHILDTLFWDDEKKMLMQSVTVPGGDVEQVPFEE